MNLFFLPSFFVRGGKPALFSNPPPPLPSSHPYIYLWVWTCSFLHPSPPRIPFLCMLPPPIVPESHFRPISFPISYWTSFHCSMSTPNPGGIIDVEADELPSIRSPLKHPRIISRSPSTPSCLLRSPPPPTGFPSVSISLWLNCHYINLLGRYPLMSLLPVKFPLRS